MPSARISRPNRVAARGDRTAAAPRSASVGDGLARAGGVVRRQQLPRPRAQERLGLAERLDVRVDPLDVLDPLAGQRGEAEAHRDDDLAADDEIVLEQQVVVLADRAVDDVLDRHDAGGRVAGRDGLEDGAEAAERRPGHVAEDREDGILGEGAGLPGDRRRRSGRAWSPKSSGRPWAAAGPRRAEPRGACATG